MSEVLPLNAEVTFAANLFDAADEEGSLRAIAHRVRTEGYWRRHDDGVFTKVKPGSDDPHQARVISELGGLYRLASRAEPMDEYTAHHWPEIITDWSNGSVLWEVAWTTPVDGASPAEGKRRLSDITRHENTLRRLIRLLLESEELKDVDDPTLAKRIGALGAIGLKKPDEVRNLLRQCRDQGLFT